MFPRRKKPATPSPTAVALAVVREQLTQAIREAEDRCDRMLRRLTEADREKSQ